MITSHSRAAKSGLLVPLALCLFATGCKEHKQLDYAASLSQSGNQAGTDLAEYYGKVAQHVRDNEQMQEAIALETVPAASVGPALVEIKRLHDGSAPGAPPLTPNPIIGVPEITLTTYSAARRNAEALESDLEARQQMAQTVAGLYASMHDIVTNKPDDVDQAVLELKAAAEKVDGHPLHVSAGGRTLTDPLIKQALTGLVGLVLDTKKLHDAHEANLKIATIVTDIDAVYVREEKYLINDEVDYYIQEDSFADLIHQAGVSDFPSPNGTLEALGGDFQIKVTGSTLTPQGQNIFAFFQQRDRETRMDALLRKAQSDADDHGSSLSHLIASHQSLAGMLKAW